MLALVVLVFLKASLVHDSYVFRVSGLQIDRSYPGFLFVMFLVVYSAENKAPFSILGTKKNC